MDPDLRWYEQPLAVFYAMLWILANAGAIAFFSNHFGAWIFHIGLLAWAISLIIAVGMVAWMFHSAARRRRGRTPPSKGPF
jgi:hypothetical protein